MEIWLFLGLYYSIDQEQKEKWMSNSEFFITDIAQYYCDTILFKVKKLLVGLMLFILSYMPSFVVVLNLKQLSWHAAF
jgi:hypothetical protein